MRALQHDVLSCFNFLPDLGPSQTALPLPEVYGAMQYAMSDCKKLVLVLACFTGQFVSVGIFLSFGPLFEALLRDTGGHTGTVALIGSLRDFLINIVQAMAGFVVKDVGFVTMSAVGAVLLVAGTFLDSCSDPSFVNNGLR